MVERGHREEVKSSSQYSELFFVERSFGDGSVKHYFDPNSKPQITFNVCILYNSKKALFRISQILGGSDPPK